MSLIDALIRELLYGPTRMHCERLTPEEIEQNRREIAIQRERDERAYRNTYPDTSGTDPKDTPD